VSRFDGIDPTTGKPLPTEHEVIQALEDYAKSKPRSTPQDELRESVLDTSIATSYFYRFDNEFIDKFFNDDGKAAIRDYVNSEVRQVLDRLESQSDRAMTGKGGIVEVPVSAIEAERKKYE
jgi:hypothetical protein